MTEYIDTAEVAKLIRKDLKAAFPSIKFGARTSRYAGGSSIRVEWTDGPTVERVEAITKRYQGSAYDSYSDCWLPVHNELNGKPVSFGANHVQTTRNLSRSFYAAMVKRICAMWYGLPEYTEGMIKETGGDYSRPYIDPDPFLNEHHRYLSQLVYEECQKFNADWLPVEIDSTDCDWHEYDPYLPFDTITYEPERVEPVYQPILSDTTLPAYTCALCNVTLAENIVHSEGRVFCEPCYDKMNAYQNRLEQRYERLQNAASRLEREGQSDYDRAHKMASIIPFGQPILVGHYSEGRDRRYRDRIHNTYGRAFDKMNRAKELQNRADHPSRAISSDDPTAALKLQDKLEQKQAYQQHMIKANKIIRRLLKANISDNERVEQLQKEATITWSKAAQLLKGDFLNRIGYPDYELRNNGAEIRRLEGRLKELQHKAAKPVEPRTVYGNITISRDVDENRLRIHFPGKPAASVIASLKQHGFRWSPSNMAWQRQLSADAEYWAVWIIEKIG